MTEIIQDKGDIFDDYFSSNKEICKDTKKCVQYKPTNKCGRKQFCNLNGYPCKGKNNCDKYYTTPKYKEKQVGISILEIDVTGCEFYNKGINFKGDVAPDKYCLINYLLKTNGFDCDSIYCNGTNCHYKQLQQQTKRADEAENKAKINTEAIAIFEDDYKSMELDLARANAKLDKAKEGLVEFAKFFQK